ncbi:MAG TPA: FAD-binding oxidoreductase [Polyangia bacterium]
MISTARLAETVTRRLFLDRQLQLWSGALVPTWSATEILARVVEVVVETRDTRTFVLEPNRRWRGHRAGQHTMVEVERDGARVRRFYSLSSAPGGRRMSITVKRVPDGRVSSFLHESLRVGDIVRLSPAAGDFVLPDDHRPELLFVSGGSGITPVMSILRDLDRRDAVEDVVFVHYARSRRDVIFGVELERLALRHPGLRVFLCLDDDHGGFDEARLAAAVPDFAGRATFLCGPAGLMERVERMWHDAGASARLRRERFSAPPRKQASGADGSVAPEVAVTLARAGRTVAVASGAPLLETLERAGERPPNGCRIGICHTCKCTKRSGTVENLLTGAISDADDEEIQLCISVPRSDVELGL